MSHFGDESIPNSEGPANTTDDPPRRPGSWLAVVIEGAAVATLTAVIAAVVIFADLRRPLGGDEPFTYYISKASGVSELLELLSRGGVDSAPPLYILAVWQVQRVIGDENLALRLPSSIGFVVMCVCLYGIARRHCSAPYAAVALLTLPQTAAYTQATNGRPYGLMLGFLGLALLCWQWTERRRWRPLALFGLAASLAAAVATHYYAILILAPLAMAEATRTIESPRKRFDVAVWVAFAFAMAPLLMFLPLMIASRELAGASWLRVDVAEIKRTYVRDLGSLLLPLLALGSLFLLRLARTPARHNAEPSDAITVFRMSEMVLVLGLIVLPVIAITVGLTVTRVYAPRYVVEYIAGVALMLAFMANSLFRGRTVFGWVLAMIMLATFLSTSALRARRVEDVRAGFNEIANYSAQAAMAGQRLVFLHGDDFIRFHLYLEPSARKNLTLVDLIDDRHARLYANLNRWLDRKGLGTFDQHDADWLTRDSNKYYLYSDANSDTAHAFGLAARHRLTIAFIDINLYAIESNASGAITLAR